MLKGPALVQVQGRTPHFALSWPLSTDVRVMFRGKKHAPNLGPAGNERKARRQVDHAPLFFPKATASCSLTFGPKLGSDGGMVLGVTPKFGDAGGREASRKAGCSRSSGVRTAPTEACSGVKIWIGARLRGPVSQTPSSTLSTELSQRWPPRCHHWSGAVHRIWAAHEVWAAHGMGAAHWIWAAHGPRAVWYPGSPNISSCQNGA